MRGCHDYLADKVPTLGTDLSSRGNSHNGDLCRYVIRFWHPVGNLVTRGRPGAFPEVCKGVQGNAKVGRDMQRWAEICKGGQRYAKVGTAYLLTGLCLPNSFDNDGLFIQQTK